MKYIVGNILKNQNPNDKVHYEYVIVAVDLNIQEVKAVRRDRVDVRQRIFRIRNMEIAIQRKQWVLYNPNHFADELFEL